MSIILLIVSDKILHNPLPVRGHPGEEARGSPAAPVSAPRHHPHQHVGAGHLVTLLPGYQGAAAVTLGIKQLDGIKITLHLYLAAVFAHLAACTKVFMDPGDTKISTSKKNCNV